MSNQKKKFFFTKEDKKIDLLDVLSKRQMETIAGGSSSSYSRESTSTYTESTYVRR